MQTIENQLKKGKQRKTKNNRKCAFSNNKNDQTIQILQYSACTPNISSQTATRKPASQLQQNHLCSQCSRSKRLIGMLCVLSVHI